MDKLAAALDKLELLLGEIRDGDEAGGKLECWFHGWTFKTNMEIIQSYRAAYAENGALDQLISLVDGVCSQGEYDAALLRIRNDPMFSKAIMGSSLRFLWFKFLGFKDQRINKGIAFALRSADAEIARKLAGFAQKSNCEELKKLADAGELRCLQDLLSALEKLRVKRG